MHEKKSSKIITILPIGPVNEDIIKHLSHSIEKGCGLKCRIDEGMDIPSHSYDKNRYQYNAKSILKHLLHTHPNQPFRLIGVTQVDLYVPILKYVFGLAQISGRFSVISLHRLSPVFYNDSPDLNLLKERTSKTALHELGHTFGLTHCRDKRCVLHSSIRIADTDYKRSVFCSTCFELFMWYLKDL